MRKGNLLGDQDFPWGYPAWLESSNSVTTLNYNTKSILEPNAAQVGPEDISLVACCGDSLLTGLGVTAHPSKLKNRIIAALGQFHISLLLKWLISGEHRHNTCISGGSNGVVSVGRLLKSCNPNLIGLNQRKTLLFSKGSDFNFARTGAQSNGLQDQVNRFIKKLSQRQYAQQKASWKLVYIWIGANDVFSKSFSTIKQTFEQHLVSSLQTLKMKVKNCIVCLMPLPNLAHLLVETNVTPERRVRILTKTALVNKILEKIAKEYTWNDELDFRVLWQPVPSDPMPIESQADLVSTLDSVHPSFMAQQLFAKCIWNNLFLKPEEKITTIKGVIESEWKKPDRHTIIS